MPTISGRVARGLDQRVAERRGLRRLARAGDRGDHRRGGQARLFGRRWHRALHAGLPASRLSSASCHSCGFDADEVVLLALLQERHALAHRVSAMIMRGFGSG